MLHWLRTAIMTLFLQTTIFRVANSLSRSLNTLQMTLSAKPVTLITLDVDGTLVQGSSKQAEYSVHARAFSHAIGRVFRNDFEYEKKVPSPLLRIPHQRYHGGTDGLIAMNYAYFDSQIPPEQSYEKLPEIYRVMYEYYSSFSDDEAIRGIDALPGVLSTLSALASSSELREHFLCGLVTGNVEGIARKKMRACGIHSLGILSPQSVDQRWQGENQHAFLGGFGSDYCSGDIQDLSRIYKDRAQQIAVAVRRARSLLKPDQQLVRVVHVGDAPSDVLAARYCYQEQLCGPDVEVACIGVATGKFAESELQELIGDPVATKWDPVVLKQGLNDPNFINACKIKTVR